jgi:DNA end-binding protein Ku
MPPRSIWNGAVSFGAVNVPIKVFGAIQDKSIHFRELHAKDASEVAHKLVGPDGEEVPRDRVAKGFEVAPDEYVLMESDEIKAADPARRKAVELEEFVPADQVDPVYYDKPYHLAPQKGAEKAYRLLVEALEKSGRVGIGRVSLRQREQLVSVRPVDGTLRMQVMRYDAALVPAKTLDVDEPKKQPTEREIGMASTLVDTLATKWEPERYENTYRDRLLELVRQKEAGEEISLEKPDEAEASDDLAAALEASLKAMKK